MNPYFYLFLITEWNVLNLTEFPMTARVDSRTTARPGDKVKFAIDVEKIHVFDKETEKIITN